MSDEKPFGPKIVAAWFETVINPLLLALPVEHERLSRKSWTWQFKPGRLESIRSVRELIPMGYGPNLEQFLRFHHEIKENVDFHDDEVRHLSVACMGLQQALMDSGALEEIMRRVTSDEALSDLGKSLESLFGGYNEMERMGWIAQCIINGSGELPDYIMHAPLWNRHRAEFVNLLNHPPMSEAKILVDGAGAKLQRIVERLIELLTETRDRLSLEYDVPPVPTALMLVE